MVNLKIGMAYQPDDPVTLAEWVASFWLDDPQQGWYEPSKFNLVRNYITRPFREPYWFENVPSHPVGEEDKTTPTLVTMPNGKKQRAEEKRKYQKRVNEGVQRFLRSQKAKAPRNSGKNYFKQSKQAVADREKRYGKPVRFGGSRGGSISVLPRASVASGTGNITEWGRGARPGCARMRTKVFLGTVFAASDGLGGSYILWAPNAGTNIGGQHYFNPANQVYASTAAFAVVCSTFDKFRMHKLTYLWEATTGTSTDYSIAWGLVKATDHWQKQGVALSTTPLTKSIILTTANSSTFPSWVPKQTIGLQWPMTDDEFYMVSPGGFDGLYSFTDANKAPQRQTYACTLGMALVGPDPGADVIVPLGDVYVMVDMELCDMAFGIVNPGPVLELKAEKKNCFHGKTVLYPGTLRQHMQQRSTERLIRDDDSARGIVMDERFESERSRPYVPYKSTSLK